jgi:hypothetical protein
MNDAAFDAPGLSRDWTEHRLGLGARSNGGERAVLLVHRTEVDRGADVVELARQNVRQATAELGGYRVLDERRRETRQGIPLVDVAAEWRGSEGVVYTRQAHLVVDGAWLVFAVNGDETTRAACDAAIERLVTTFRSREDA